MNNSIFVSIVVICCGNIIFIIFRSTSDLFKIRRRNLKICICEGSSASSNRYKISEIFDILKFIFMILNHINRTCMMINPRYRSCCFTNFDQLRIRFFGKRKINDKNIIMCTMLIKSILVCCLYIGFRIIRNCLRLQAMHEISRRHSIHVIVMINDHMYFPFFV